MHILQIDIDIETEETLVLVLGFLSDHKHAFFGDQVLNYMLYLRGGFQSLFLVSNCMAHLNQHILDNSINHVALKHVFAVL